VTAVGHGESLRRQTIAWGLGPFEGQRRAGGPEVCAPTSRRIDARLLIGSSIFGIGWSIGGACPGPALTTLGAGASWAAVFVGAMALGLVMVRSRA
jgi:uncharacterized membrane protein YedE/YeeE